MGRIEKGFWGMVRLDFVQKLAAVGLAIAVPLIVCGLMILGLAATHPGGFLFLPRLFIGSAFTVTGLLLHWLGFRYASRDALVFAAFMLAVIGCFELIRASIQHYWIGLPAGATCWGASLYIAWRARRIQRASQQVDPLEAMDHGDVSDEDRHIATLGGPSGGYNDELP